MNKKILSLAIPNIISNITVPLLGIIDLAIVGHLDSEVYIGAIALGGVIFNFIYWSFAFLRMSTSGFTSQSYGERNLEKCIAFLVKALIFAAVTSFFLILFQKPIAFLSFKIIEGSPDVEQLALQYFYIRIWAAPASLALYATSGWLIGMQNAKTPMVIAITVNILNIIFSMLFVVKMGMKSDGIALGTVVAQYSGLFLSLFFIHKYYKKMYKYLNLKKILKAGSFKSFLRVNKDIFIRMLCIIFVFTFFTSKSASKNDLILAVNTLLLQFLLIFSYLIDGFAYAGEALVGKFIGSKNKTSLNRVIKLLFLWGFGIGFLFTVLYAAGGDFILRILTDNQDIIAEAAPFKVWIVFIPILTVASFVWDGVYIGATASKAMRNTLLVATLFVFIPTYVIGSQFMGNHALWLALILFMSSRGIIQTIIAKRVIYPLV
ncbi:MAG: MATE family efflux transporter [Bacteroidia bacterium]|nr:MAG: MATE family efflux transporter [Bacteroidia bacterium]